MPVFKSACASAPYQMRKGDILDIFIFEAETLSHSYTVQEDGTITVPYIGESSVENLTLDQIKSTITNKLKDGYIHNPIVKIEIKSYDPIYILGEVTNPGQYNFSPETTALQAIAIAGGYTYRANKKTFKLISKKSAQNESKITPNYILQPGDTVIIKERFF